LWRWRVLSHRASALSSWTDHMSNWMLNAHPIASWTAPPHPSRLAASPLCCRSSLHRQLPPPLPTPKAPGPNFFAFNMWHQGFWQVEPKWVPLFFPSLSLMKSDLFPGPCFFI
jgi:hypothetical protein